MPSSKQDLTIYYLDFSEWPEDATKKHSGSMDQKKLQGVHTFPHI